MAEVGEGVLVNGFGIAAAFLIGAVDQQQLLKEVGTQQGAPAGADERLGQVAQAVVGVAAAGREDLDGPVAVGVQDVAKVGGVLAEAAGALRGGHEEGHALGVHAGALQQTHEVAHGYFGGVTFVAGGVALAQFAGAVVGGRRGFGLQADGAEGGGKRAGAAVGHGRDVDALAGYWMG